MSTSCKELMELFKTMGGKMECDYITKKCTHIHTLPSSLSSCHMTTPDDVRELENVINDISLKPYVKVYHFPTSNGSVSIERLHRFHLKNINGIAMEFTKENKIWYDSILRDGKI
jgi:hypothetical protein